MSYSLYNEDGWLGQLASVSGFRDVLHTVGRRDGLLSEFLTRGHSSEASEIANEAAERSIEPELPSSVRKTLRNLADLASKSGGFIIISDTGQDDSEESTDEEWDAKWEESKHPRVRSGEGGGQFTSKGHEGGAAGEKEKPAEEQKKSISPPPPGKASNVQAGSRSNRAATRESVKGFCRNPEGDCAGVISSLGQIFESAGVDSRLLAEPITVSVDHEMGEGDAGWDWPGHDSIGLQHGRESQSMGEILCHEFGHHVDYLTDPTKSQMKGMNRQAMVPAFAEMLDEYKATRLKAAQALKVPAHEFDYEALERRKKNRPILGKLAPHNGYALTNKSEWFAVNWNEWFSGGGRRDRLARRFPKTFAYMDSLAAGKFFKE